MADRLKIHLATLAKCAMLFSIVFFISYYAGGVDRVMAQSTGSIYGYAWSDNIGWISLNGANYGLSVATNNTVSGYAWSDNIGWVSANGADVSGCPSNPCTPRLQGGAMTGWLKALEGGTAESGGWDGWISLSGPGYGITQSGNNFSGYAWGGDVVGWTDFSSATFTPSGSGPYTLTVTKAGTGSGTVTSAPAGINCGTTCNASYVADTVVNLTATPAGGSTFSGWSGGGCSGTGVCAVTMSSAQNVTATFASVSTDCGASTATWTVGSNTCSGSYSTITNGNSSPVSSTNGKTGTVTITCNNGTPTQSNPSCTPPGGSCPAPSAFTTPGTYQWTAPPGVTSVSVIAVGGGGSGAPGWRNNTDRYSGGGGGGGGLGYKNNIPVIPGNSYTVVVGAGGAAVATGNSYSSTGSGANGGTSSFNSSLFAYGGKGGNYDATTPALGGGKSGADGGGVGGSGWGGGIESNRGGGGGAGGYSGNGGDGGPIGDINGGSGTGGGGGGGGGNGLGYAQGPNGASGGGVGIFGAGANGSAGSGSVFSTGTNATGGGGGSGGTKGGDAYNGQDPSGAGGLYGGGSGGASYVYSGSSAGGGGAVVVTPVTCAAPSPSCSVLDVNPSSINSGDPVTLTWSCQNASSCIAIENTEGFSTGGSLSGTDSSVTPSATSGQVTYGLICDANTFYFSFVTVRSPIVNISADPSRVRSDNTSVISWSASDVKSCTVSGPSSPPYLASGNADNSNNFTRNSPYTTPPITAKSTYTIVCKTDGADITDSVTVNVGPAFQEF